MATTPNGSEPRQISGLQDVSNPAAQLPGGFFGVDIPNPIYNPLAPGGVKQFLTRRLSAGALISLLQGLSPDTNLLKGTPKLVLFATAQEAAAGGGGSSLESLPNASLCVGTAATVLLPYPRRLILAADPSGPLTVAVDGSFLGPTRTARWVLEHEAFAYGEDVFNPLRTQYEQGQRVSYRPVAGEALRLFSARLLLRRVDFTNNRIPAPTGATSDPNWEEVSPPNLTHRQNTDLGTENASFTIALNSQNQEQGEQRTPLFLGKGQGSRPAALALLWQKADNSLVSELQFCADYRDPLISRPSDPPNVWRRVLLEGDTVPGGGGTGVTGEEFTDATYDPATGQLELISANGSVLLTIGAGITPAQLLRLPVATPTSRLLWVHNGGQVEVGQVGNASRPYATIAAAHTAAQDGDRIVILPGTYTEPEIVIRKNVHLVCLPDVRFSLSLIIGGFGGSQPFDIVLIGGEFIGNGRLVVIRQNTGASKFTWRDGVLSGSSYVWCWGGVSSGNHTDDIRLLGLRGQTLVSTTQSSGGVGFRGVTLGARTDAVQSQQVTLDDCVVEVLNGEPILFQAHQTSRVVLRGVTRLDRPAATAATRTLPLVPSGQQLSEATWLIDSRVAAGGPSSETYQAANDGTARYNDVVVLAPKAFALVATVNATGYSAQVLKATDNTAWGPVRTVAADITADIAAAFADASSPSSVLLRVEPVRQDTTRLSYVVFSLS